MKRNKKLLFARRAVSTLVLISVLILSAPQAQADAWGSNYAATIMDQVMDKIEHAIEGALLAALKIAAIEALNSQVGQLVTGATLGQKTLFITNYNDFLYRNPTQRADLFMNDFFTLTTRGKAYGSNYIGAGYNQNFAGNYGAYLIGVGRQAVLGNRGVNIVNLDEYIPSPDRMFAEGDWRAFNAFFSNPANNPYGYALQAEQAYQQNLAMEQQKAMVQAISAGGFLPAERNGMVMTPAGAIQSIVADVTTLANRVVVASQNPAELAAGVVLAVANRMMKSLIQRGLGEMQAKLHNEMGKVDRAVFDYNNGMSQKYGEASMFLNETAQRTHAIVNATTPPPPGYVKKK